MKNQILLAGLTVLAFHIGLHQSPAQKLKVIGVSRTEHSIEPSLMYTIPHSADLSARYEWFVQNPADRPLNSASARNLLVNGNSPANWHTGGKISWYGIPDNNPSFPKMIPPKALMVWQLNGKSHDWVKEDKIRLQTSALDTMLSDAVQPIYISLVTFTGEGPGINPDRVHIHLANRSETSASIAGVRLWLPQPGENRLFLFPGSWQTPNLTLPANAQLPAGGRSLMRVDTSPLPPGPAVLEVKLNTGHSESISLWAKIKVRKESFDISAGWANDRIGGKPAFLNERFLQSMKSLYINTAHYEGQLGYSDNPELFTKYPMKYFHRLGPGAPYDTDSMMSRIHGVEFLGEPQYGGGTPVDPQKVYDQLLPYLPGRLSTTLTHSEERIWRYYAGLSDYPHYDAYRVSAPSPDDWKKYNRWNGRRIGWGSPLEGIGTMTRSLRSLNRPMPVAYWSQGAHSGWEVYDGRKRTSPTPAELRAQAYHGLASGITSLYWFNLSYSSLKAYPDLLQPIQQISREMRLLDDFYLKSDLWDHQVQANWDLSTLVSENGVLLFTLELGYRPDYKTRTFVFPDAHQASVSFKVPEWTDNSWLLYKLTGKGLTKVSFKLDRIGQLQISDLIAEAGIYVLIKDQQQYLNLEHKWQNLIKAEQQLEFNPAQKQNDLLELLRLDGK